MYGWSCRWRMVMLGECSVMNVDICASFALKYCVGSREMTSVHNRESVRKYKRAWRRFYQLEWRYKWLV